MVDHETTSWETYGLNLIKILKQKGLLYYNISKYEIRLLVLLGTWSESYSGK